MDDAALAKQLDELAEPARKLFTNQHERGTVAQIDSLVATLVPKLAAHPTFGVYKERFFGSKQLMLDPHWIGRNLLEASTQRGSPAAVQWLHRLYLTEVADIRLIAEVHGLTVQRPLPLSNGVSILPLDAIPPSPNSTALRSTYQSGPSWNFPTLSAVPSVAVLELRNVRGSPTHEAGASVSDDGGREIKKAVRAFTLAKEAAPVIGVSWIDFIDPDLTQAEFGRKWMGENFEGVLGLVRSLKVDADDLAWAECYLHLMPELHAVCDVAVDRLNLARRRHSPGDKAIEGSICLEALLGDDNAGEQTYKLALRAALLLETELDARQQIRSDIARFYSLRSKTVHGRPRSGKQAQNDAACAARGLAICARALRKIVEMNERPAPAIWELSGGPQI